MESSRSWTLARRSTSTSTSFGRRSSRGIPTVRTTLDEARDALEADHAFPTRGGVFSYDRIATCIEFRREQSDRVKIRPHPYEFPMYFDG